MVSALGNFFLHSLQKRPLNSIPRSNPAFLMIQDTHQIPPTSPPPTPQWRSARSHFAELPHEAVIEYHGESSEFQALADASALVPVPYECKLHQFLESFPAFASSFLSMLQYIWIDEAFWYCLVLEVSEGSEWQRGRDQPEQNYGSNYWELLLSFCIIFNIFLIDWILEAFIIILTFKLYSWKLRARSVFDLLKLCQVV